MACLDKEFRVKVTPSQSGDLSMSYTGQTIFIVGGSSGIGLAAACQFAKGGADVVIFARRKEVLIRAENEIHKHQTEQSPNAASYVLDASSHGETEDVFTRAILDHGPPSILINSAGGATPHRFLDMDADQLDQTLTTNVATCWNPCKVIAPVMVSKGTGTIVNVASLAGLIGIYGYTDYSLAKYGVVGFSEALRAELKPLGIKVQVFCPPDTQTPGYDNENKTKPRETAVLSGGAKLMSADAVARSLLSGLATRKFVTLANFESKIFWGLQRYAPTFGRIYMDRIIAKA
jgi:3-dehydrosphinganine reductase